MIIPTKENIKKVVDEVYKNSSHKQIKEFVEANKNSITYSRRRYGNTTYTWLIFGDEDMGDPVPKIRPSAYDIAFSLIQVFLSKNKEYQILIP